MIEANSPNYVFKFIAVKPAAPLPDDLGWTIPLTDEQERIATAEPAERLELAEQLRNDDLDPNKSAIVAEANRAADGASDVSDYRDRMANADAKALTSEFANLRDALFARYWLGGETPGDGQTVALERALMLLHLAIGDLPKTVLAQPMDVALSRSPSFGGGTRSKDAALTGIDDVEVPDPADDGPDTASLTRAVSELSSLQDAPNLLSQGDADAKKDARPVGALTDLGVRMLSHESRSVLDALDIPLEQPVFEVISNVEAIASARALTGVAGVAAAASRVPIIRGLVRPAGVADLLVVKQHIKKYQPSEIAHVENVMIGEKRARVHRRLDRTEDVFVTEREMTTETLEELQSTERHEMNKEATKTIKSDQKMGLELSLSGKYGPTVEFSSKASMEASTSNERSTQSSSTFAREVMSRSMTKIIERVREQRTLTILHEVEETNEHSFDNQTDEHINGIYQFLEKVYANRIFNYGKRMMFDFMVPEPAHYLWHLTENPLGAADMPQPPRPLEELVANAAAISTVNYRSIAALYGAEGIDPPPSAEKTVFASYKHGDGGSESGNPRSSHTIEVDIPNGYRPVRVRGRVIALTDDDASFNFMASNVNDVFFEDGGTSVGSGQKYVRRTFELGVETFREVPNNNKLGVNVFAFESNNYAITLRVQCARTNTLFDQWKQETFEAIQRAYLDRLTDYEQRVAQIEREAAEAEDSDDAPFGDSPLNNRIRVLQELRKHCITLLTGQHYDIFNPLFPGNPPRINIPRAFLEGSFIRFFEQAFEWDQMQYVFYPYYWASKATWQRRFEHRDNDTLFQEFLRAGSARVVAPVRPGFERAVNYYLETGLLWNGLSEPPLIGDDLYISIITEIEERTGKGKGEEPVGEEWESRLPTNLVLLRRDSSLPEWTNAHADGWQWEPA